MGGSGQHVHCSLYEKGNLIHGRTWQLASATGIQDVGEKRAPLAKPKATPRVLQQFEENVILRADRATS